MEILLCTFYTLVFLWLITRLKFFTTSGISRTTLALIFLLKVTFGVALWAVYTYVYTDRSTADIYKFFDDSKFIYDALFVAPLDYVKMLFGISSNTPHFDVYYMQMNHWHREFETGFYNEYRTLIRLNALLRIFSFGCFNVHTVFMSFLSFCGLVAIYKAFVPYLQNKKTELMVVVFLLPSVLFWGSGVLKESFILFILGTLIYLVSRLLNKEISFSVPALVGVAVLLTLIFFTRLYIFLIIVPALIAFSWVHANPKSPVLKYLLVFGAYFFFILSIGYVLPKYNLLEKIAGKQHQILELANGGSWLMHENKLVYISENVTNRITLIGNTSYGKINPGVPYKYIYREQPKDTFFVAASTDTTTYWIFYDQPRARSHLDIGKLEPNLPNLVKNTPQALVNSLLRPFLFDAKSLLMFLPAVENFFIAVFIFLCLLFYSKSFLNKNVIYFCLSISFLLLILIGLTTPVMGALVRYKVPAMPFLLIAFLSILDKERLTSRLPFIQRKNPLNK